MKNNLLSLFFIAAAAGFIIFPGGCTSDKLPEPMPPSTCDSLMVTYENQVKEIIDFTCAVVGCHLPGGIGPGNYETYDGIKPYLEDGSFEERVIDMKDDPEFGMPPNYSTSGPTDLTPEELEIMECWISTGFPES